MSNIPEGIFKIRENACKSCNSPCDIQNDIEKKNDPCARCPVFKWWNVNCERKFVPIEDHSITPHGVRQTGLGDKVYKVANPIAKIIDKTTSVLPRSMQTNIEGCGGCKKRREALNNLFPSRKTK